MSARSLAGFGCVCCLGAVLMACTVESPALSERASGAEGRSTALPLDGTQDVPCGGFTPAAHPSFEAIRRLATSREEVRILVYGQSISEQGWWQKTKAWLAQMYPQGNLVMEEHARGGCAAQCLIGHERWSIDGKQYNRLPEDVFAWRPDLVIFHVYGDHVDYGFILKALKQGCAAFDDYRTHDGLEVPAVRCTPEQRAISAGYKAPEVLIQSDFIASNVPVECPADPTPANWNCFMNEKVIPENVARYGYRLQDNFHLWPAYIKRYGLAPTTLLQADQTHLSEPAGSDVMFRTTAPYLCYVPVAAGT